MRRIHCSCSRTDRSSISRSRSSRSFLESSPSSSPSSSRTRVRRNRDFFKFISAEPVHGFGEEVNRFRHAAQQQDADGRNEDEQRGEQEAAPEKASPRPNDEGADVLEAAESTRVRIFWIASSDAAVRVTYDSSDIPARSGDSMTASWSRRCSRK